VTSVRIQTIAAHVRAVETEACNTVGTVSVSEMLSSAARSITVPLGSAAPNIHAASIMSRRRPEFAERPVRNVN